MLLTWKCMDNLLKIWHYPKFYRLVSIFNVINLLVSSCYLGRNRCYNFVALKKSTLTLSLFSKSLKETDLVHSSGFSLREYVVQNPPSTHFPHQKNSLTTFSTSHIKNIIPSPSNSNFHVIIQ